MSDEEAKAESTPSGTRKKILLVDDDREIVESMRIALDASGFETLVARDGNQGLAMVECEDPDLVILDMMMPRVSGFIVLERLKQHHRLSVPIIMLSANDSDQQRAYAEFLGADLYLHKPIRPAVLFQAVDQLCQPLAATVPA